MSVANTTAGQQKYARHRLASNTRDGDLDVVVGAYRFFRPFLAACRDLKKVIARTRTRPPLSILTSMHGE